MAAEWSGSKRKFEQSDEKPVVVKTFRLENRKITRGGTYLEENGKFCYHRLVLPEGTKISEESPPKFQGPCAKDFSFELDPFQTVAIGCLEAGDSVLVSAHTSAGKTVVAEYACAMALRDNTRMIYTSPLKALSNQKYRELYDNFQDVGLLTGDTTINETASCLVVTTEIFRSMLYENNTILREIKSVVFDEVHYLRDKERGYVWEECLILMPKKIQAIFLSATVPNSIEFASWFASVHESRCHVVYTENRPVPLQHYIFPVGSEAVYLVIDEKDKFLEENLQKGYAEIVGDSIAVQLRKHKENKYSLEDASDIFKLMKMVLERDYDPAIVFSFSKKTCEQLALQLAHMEINNEEEQRMVEYILKNAVDSLSDHDRRLPQVQQMFPMLKRGIGVHHSGLLPIVKEVVELLFQEGFIKILFATETFSTGLNMPAKTVVFAGSKKFDNGSFRWIYPGEYIQMSGRAGRRGIDEKGIVILIVDKSIDISQAREILKGDPLLLLSEFRLSYRMILDNLKMEGGDPEQIIKKSYRQYLSKASIPQLKAQLEEVEAALVEMNVDEKYKLVEQLIEDQNEKNELDIIVRKKLTQPKNCLQFLNPGRLVALVQDPTIQAIKIVDPETYKISQHPFWGLIINFKKKEKTKQNEDLNFVLDALVNCKKNQDGGYECLHYNDELGAPHVLSFEVSQISQLSTIRVNLPENLKTVSGRLKALKCLREVIRRLHLNPGKIPLLDPIKDMKISSEKLKKTVKTLRNVRNRLDKSEVTNCPDFQGRLEKYFHYQNLLTERKSLQKDLEGAKDMILKSELRHMEKALVKLKYIDETGLVLEKGRVAVHFRTADELLLTELVFNGKLTALNGSQLAATVACCVLPDNTRPEFKASSEMDELFSIVQKTALEIGKVLVDCKAIQSVSDYAQQFSPVAMEAVYNWSKGGSFMEVFKLADVYEGSLVRVIRQVSRILSELEDAAQTSGLEELKQKLQNAQELIKRDVIFAGSLYL